MDSRLAEQLPDGGAFQGKDWSCHVDIPSRSIHIARIRPACGRNNFHLNFEFLEMLAAGGVNINRAMEGVEHWDTSWFPYTPKEVVKEYGPTGTIHSTDHIDVEVRDGEVVQVWFRCLMLKFQQHDTTERRPMQGVSVAGIKYKYIQPEE